MGSSVELLRGYFLIISGIQWIAFQWFIVVAADAGSIAQHMPRHELAGIGNAHLLYPALVVITVLCSLSWAYHWVLFSVGAFDKNERSKSRVALGLLLLLDLILVGLPAFGSLYLQTRVIPWNSCETLYSNDLFQTWAQLRPDNKSTHRAKDICTDMYNIEQETMSFVVLSLHVNTVGWLLTFLPAFEVEFTYWPNAWWRTNDWGQGRAVPYSWMLRILQWTIAPFRLLWRCWCRTWLPILHASWKIFVFGICVPLLFLIISPFLLMKRCLAELKSDHPFRTNPTFRKPQQGKGGVVVELQEVTVGSDNGSNNSGSSAIEKFLTIDDLFLELLPHLHGPALRSFRCASKTLREIIDRHGGIRPQRHLPCGGSTDRCLLCDLTVCEICKGGSVDLTDISVAQGRKTLRAACTWCYFKNLFYPTELFSSVTLKCRKPTCSQNHGSIKRNMCEDCHTVLPLRNTMALKRRDVKVGSNLSKNYESDPRQCFFCQSSLWAFSARWWGCSICGEERRDVDIFGFRERWRCSWIGRHTKWIRRYNPWTDAGYLQK